MEGQKTAIESHRELRNVMEEKARRIDQLLISLQRARGLDIEYWEQLEQITHNQEKELDSIEAEFNKACEKREAELHAQVSKELRANMGNMRLARLSEEEEERKQKETYQDRVRVRVSEVIDRILARPEEGNN